jgi:hypothetical protein
MPWTPATATVLLLPYLHGPPSRTNPRPRPPGRSHDRRPWEDLAHAVGAGGHHRMADQAQQQRGGRMVGTADADGVVLVDRLHHVASPSGSSVRRPVRASSSNTRVKRARPGLTDQFLGAHADPLHVLAVLVELSDVERIVFACASALDLIEAVEGGPLDPARDAVDGLRGEDDQAAGLHDLRGLLDPVQISRTTTNLDDLCCHGANDTRNARTLQGWFITDLACATSVRPITVQQSITREKYLAKMLAQPAYSPNSIKPPS